MNVSKDLDETCYIDFKILLLHASSFYKVPDPIISFMVTNPIIPFMVSDPTIP